MIRLDIISQIESDNNDKLVGKAGERGRFQIREKKGVLDDWNAMHKTKFTGDDLEDWLTSKTIAEWFLNYYLPKRYFVSYEIPDTWQNRVIAWNYGVGNLVKWLKSGGEISKLPEVTQRYLKKYQEAEAK